MAPAARPRRARAAGFPLRPAALTLAIGVIAMELGRIIRRRRRSADAQLALARVATALAVTSLGALAIGSVAIGALAVRALAIKSARIHRLEIDELHVRSVSGALPTAS